MGPEDKARQEIDRQLEACGWSVQVKAIENLEKSLAENRPRALIQMTMGSGKSGVSSSNEAEPLVSRFVKHYTIYPGSAEAHDFRLVLSPDVT